MFILILFLQIILMWSLLPERWVSVRSQFRWWESCATLPNQVVYFFFTSPAAAPGSQNALNDHPLASQQVATSVWRPGVTLTTWNTKLPWRASWSRWSEKGCGPAWKRLRWKSGRGQCQRRSTDTFPVPCTSIRSCRTCGMMPIYKCTSNGTELSLHISHEL